MFGQGNLSIGLARLVRKGHYPTLGKVNMSMMDPGNLSDAEIQHSLGVLRRAESREVTRAGRGSVRIKNRPKKAFKGVLDLPDNANLNTPVKIEIELPAYLVAACGLTRGARDQFIREAVQEKLRAQGSTWWQPRFMAVLKAREIAANIRFTAKSRLE